MRPGTVDPSKPTVAARLGLVTAYALLVTFNVLSSMGWLGPNQGDISGKYPSSLVPAGYAFSIWGVIFMLQGAAAVYAALDTGYQMPGKCAAVNAVAIGWPLTWLFETAWLLVFPRETTATFYISALLLFCGLGAIGWTAGRTHALASAPPDARPNQFVWALFVLPTSMNAAWMSVASCLGLDVLAVSQGLPSNNEVALAATLAIIVACVGAAIILAYRDVAWGLVLIWAFVAVLRAHQHLHVIRTLAVIAIGVAALCSGYVALRHWQERRSSWSQAAGEGGAGAASVQEPLLAGAQPGPSSAAPPVQA